MDKIVGKYDVCMWKPSSRTDAMDQIICPTENASVIQESVVTELLDETRTKNPSTLVPLNLCKGNY